MKGEPKLFLSLKEEKISPIQQILQYYLCAVHCYKQNKMNNRPNKYQNICFQIICPFKNFEV